MHTEGFITQQQCERMRHRTFKRAIIGGGSAGIGLLVAADSLHALPIILEQGVVLIETTRTHLGDGSFSTYQQKFACTNSPGDDYYHEIDPIGSFATVLNERSRSYRYLRRYHNRIVRFPTVGEFLRTVGDRANELLDASPNSALITNPVSYATINQSANTLTPRFTFYDHQHLALAGTNEAFFATGSYEHLHVNPEDKPFCHKSLFVSQDIITGAELPTISQEVTSQLTPRAEPIIYIAGNSHSAYLTAYILKQALIERLVVQKRSESDIKQLLMGKIAVIGKHLPHIFFQTEQEADNALYLLPDSSRRNAVASNGAVYRYSGLRGPARTIAINIHLSHQEDMVTFIQYPGNPWEYIRQVRDGIVAIQALGLTTNRIPIFDEKSHELIGPLTERNGLVHVGSQGELPGRTGYIPYAFGIGSGYAFASKNAEQFGGESDNLHRGVLGVNGSQGEIGKILMKASIER